MKEIRKVFGPYNFQHTERKFVIISYVDGTKKTTSYARHLMEIHLGRDLGRDEEVDHVDDDYTNDDISNLQVLTGRANRVKAIGPPEMIEIICVFCGKKKMRLARQERHNRGMGKAGPFCGKSCAGRYGASVQKQARLSQ